MKRLSPIFFLYVLLMSFTPQAQAQTATAYFHSISFKEIPLTDATTTSVPHMTDDGRAGTIFHTWYENDTAWRYDVYMVMVASGKTETNISPTSLVEIDGRDELTTTTRWGDPSQSAAIFAWGVKHGETASHFYLITATRPFLNSYPNPNPATIRIYRLIHSSPQKAGHSTLDHFILQKSITIKDSSNAEEAIRDVVELSEPAP